MNKDFTIRVEKNEKMEKDIKKELTKLMKKIEKIGGKLRVEIEETNISKDYNIWRIEVIYEPKMADYELVGVNKKNVDEYIYIPIKKDINVPTNVKKSKICQHCNTKRNRKKLYVFRKISTNEFISVGSTCCKEYFGIDVDREIINFEKIIEKLGSIKLSYYTINEDNYVSVDSVLMKIITYYYSYDNKLKNVNYSSYKDELKEVINSYSIFYDEYGKTLKDNRADIFKEIEEIKEYILNMNDIENEYLNNVKLILQNDKMSNKLVSYLSYVYRMVQLDKYNKQEKEQNSSNYIGEVGNKIEIEVAFDKAFSYLSYYNDDRVYINLFKDRKGNVLKWVTGKQVKDGNYILKGRIKEHSSYKDTKQTVVTRCNLIEI